MLSGKPRHTYDPFLPTRGTLTDPVDHAQQRHRRKVQNSKWADEAPWEPKTVPNELLKILPEEAYDKETKKYHQVDTLARLPDLCIHHVLSLLTLHDLGRVACWSKFWKAYTSEMYDRRYWVEANKVREKLMGIWSIADRMWDDNVAHTYAYIQSGTAMTTIRLYTQPSNTRRRKQWKSPIINVRIPAGTIVPEFPGDDLYIF